MPLPEHLSREEEIIEPEGIDENWVRIGEKVTEQLEHKPGEMYVRRIIRHKYALKKDLQLQQELEVDGSLNKTVMIAPLPLLPLPYTRIRRGYCFLVDRHIREGNILKPLKKTKPELNMNWNKSG